MEDFTLFNSSILHIAQILDLSLLECITNYSYSPRRTYLRHNLTLTPGPHTHDLWFIASRNALYMVGASLLNSDQPDLDA